MPFDRRFRLLPLSRGLVGVALALHFAACGDSEGSQNAGTGSEGGAGSSASGGQSMDQDDADFDTGVDGDKRPSDLTPTEVDQVCEATRDYVEASVEDEDVCRVLAAVASLESEEPTAACEAAYTGCLEQRSAAADAVLPCVVDEECDVTVAEYEACVEAFVTTAAPVLTGFPACDDVTPFSLLPLAGLLDLPACEVVNERCGLPLPELQGP